MNATQDVGKLDIYAFQLGTIRNKRELDRWLKVETFEFDSTSARLIRPIRPFVRLVIYSLASVGNPAPDCSAISRLE